MKASETIDLNKSPLSGDHVTEADSRRRRYAAKCKRMELVGEILNEALAGSQLDLFAERISFRVSGSQLFCHWSNDMAANFSVCDRAMQIIEERCVAVQQKDKDRRKAEGVAIGKALDAEGLPIFSYGSKDAFQQIEALSLALARIQGIRNEVITKAHYGK